MLLFSTLNFGSCLPMQFITGILPSHYTSSRGNISNTTISSAIGPSLPIGDIIYENVLQL